MGPHSCKLGLLRRGSAVALTVPPSCDGMECGWAHGRRTRDKRLGLDYRDAQARITGLAPP